jgi:hypothetical protein
LAGARLFDEKSAKMLDYSGLDCGMLEFFTHKPQSKDQLLTVTHFWGEIFQYLECYGQKLLAVT